MSENVIDLGSGDMFTFPKGVYDVGGAGIVLPDNYALIVLGDVYDPNGKYNVVKNTVPLGACLLKEEFNRLNGLVQFALSAVETAILQGTTPL